MNKLEILIIPVLADNYMFLIHDSGSGATACVDPAVSKPVIEAAQDRGWAISHILVTHPHFDHIGGIADIVQTFGAKVYGSRFDFNDIPKCDVGVSEGDKIDVGGASCKVLDVPGHTAHHVAYVFAGALFCGDTLFSLGCGRLLGGTAGNLWRSLKKIRALPAATKVYCAHEYTTANANFAMTIDPDNVDLKARMDEVTRLRGLNLPTVPTTVGSEAKCNPFLRCDHLDIQNAVGLGGETPERVFTELRRRKDHF